MISSSFPRIEANPNPNKKTSKISPFAKLSKGVSSKKDFKLNRLFTKIKENQKSFAKKDSGPTSLINFAPINLLNRIRVLLKVANVFRFRTQFRSIKFINEAQLGLIDDASHFPGKQQKEFFLKRFTEKNVNKKKLYCIFIIVFIMHGFLFLLDFFCFLYFIWALINKI